MTEQMTQIEELASLSGKTIQGVDAIGEYDGAVFSFTLQFTDGTKAGFGVARDESIYIDVEQTNG